jgi:hypothetical protein
MFHFLGSALDLDIDHVLVQGTNGPCVFTARDFVGRQWLVAEAAVEDGQQPVWICASQSDRAVEHVRHGRAGVIDAIRHSLDGRVELVVLLGKDRAVRCADLKLRPVFAGTVDPEREVSFRPSASARRVAA